MQEYHPSIKSWGESVFVKENFIEVLKRELIRYKPSSVMVCSACDGWMVIEKDYLITKRAIELLLSHGWNLRILTKSCLVKRDFDLMSYYKDQVLFGVSICCDKEFSLLLEPFAPSTSERMKLLEEATSLGIRSYLSLSPLIFGIGNIYSFLEKMLTFADSLNLSYLFIDTVRVDRYVKKSLLNIIDPRYINLSLSKGFKKYIIKAIRKIVKKHNISIRVCYGWNIKSGL